MKEEIYEFLKNRVTKQRVISPVSSNDINSRLYKDQKGLSTIYETLNELCVERNEIHKIFHNGPNHKYDNIRFYYEI